MKQEDKTGEKGGQAQNGPPAGKASQPVQTGWLERGEKNLRYYSREPKGLVKSREDVLADWVGEERVAQVFAELRPVHDNVNTLIDQVLSGVQSGDALMLSKLEASWGQLFDRSIASQCRPLSVKDGHLKIEVANPTFLYVFERQKKQDFLQAMSAFSGGQLKSIEFVPRGTRRWHK